MRMMARAMAVIVALAALASHHLVLGPAPAEAHPLGNFSINHYSGLRLTPAGLEVTYVIDMAEIPTFQEMQDHGLVAEQTHASVPGYVGRRVEEWRQGLVVEVDGRRLSLVPGVTEIIFREGAGGLPTLKLGVTFRTAWDLAHGTVELRYRDANFPGRAGWKEVVARAGDGIELVESTVPSRDRSRQLADYPDDLLQSPPQHLEARVRFVPGGAVVAASRDGASEDEGRRPAATSAGGATTHRARAPGPARAVLAENSDADRREVSRPPAVRGALTLTPSPQRSPRDAFTQLVTARESSLTVLLVALIVAAGLGAVHALEPGHGKTVVAAYLVGSRGTAAHAFWLGLIVTASHTAGVYLLGAIVLYASHHVVPEQLYPWLGAGSGLMIAGLGAALFFRRYAAREYHSHPHGSGSHHHHVTAGEVSAGQLFALGVSGGIVPCPGALVVLLGALAFGRVGLGLLLIVAFSVGLAAVLIAIGLLMVYAGRVMARFHGDGPLLTRWVPLGSAAAVTVLGVSIAIRSLVAV
jgi:ABC-type nickel/cobalt efflux system permease component RcnA